MQSLNQVEVATDKKTVNIGPGNRWVNIYPKLDDLDLIMVGGRVSPVGVGGLVTGGMCISISSVPTKKILASSNVISHRVVFGLKFRDSKYTAPMFHCESCFEKKNV